MNPSKTAEKILKTVREIVPVSASMIVWNAQYDWTCLATDQLDSSLLEERFDLRAFLDRLSRSERAITTLFHDWPLNHHDQTVKVIGFPLQEKTGELLLFFEENEYEKVSQKLVNLIELSWPLWAQSLSLESNLSQAQRQFQQSAWHVSQLIHEVGKSSGSLILLTVNYQDFDKHSVYRQIHEVLPQATVFELCPGVWALLQATCESKHATEAWLQLTTLDCVQQAQNAAFGASLWDQQMPQLNRIIWAIEAYFCSRTENKQELHIRPVSWLDGRDGQGHQLSFRRDVTNLQLRQQLVLDALPHTSQLQRQLNLLSLAPPETVTEAWLRDVAKSLGACQVTLLYHEQQFSSETTPVEISEQVFAQFGQLLDQLTTAGFRDEYGFHVIVPISKSGPILLLVQFLTQLTQPERVLCELAQCYQGHLQNVFANATAQTTITSSDAPQERKQRDITSKNYHRLIGHSNAMKRVCSILDRVVDSDVPVLIQGETGTGKELIAKSLHEQSPRKHQAFVTINCSALNESLLESELFGHIKGAFTGANEDRIGYFEKANHGTLFLDEIQDMSVVMQRELLRVLAEKEVQRVGSKTPIPIDVRVVAAGNKKIARLVEEKKFRLDLYHRLNVIIIDLPPLRQRREDIPQLIEHFLTQLSSRYSMPRPEITEEARQYFLEHDYPGNIRELQNTLEKTILMLDEPVIRLTDIHFGSSTEMTGVRLESASMLPYKEARDRFARDYIRACLQRHEGHVTKAAESAGLVRTSFHKMMKKHGIDAKSFHKDGRR